MKEKKKVNFRIIEGDYSKYDKFVEMYNNRKISTEYIKRKLGVAFYNKYRGEALREGDIEPRPLSLKINNNFKYYHYDKVKKKYRVRKVKNGKYMSFGFYDTEEEAKQRVEELKKINWNEIKG